MLPIFRGTHGVRLIISRTMSTATPIRLTRLAAAIPLGVFVITACSESSSITAISTVTSVTPIAGNLQVGTVGTTLTDSLIVLVTNSRGVGVANVPVTWTLNTHSGSLSNYSSAETNSSGIAKIAWTLGTIPSTDSMTAV